MSLVRSPPTMNLHALTAQADYSRQQDMTRFLEAVASRHNDFESLVGIETRVDFNHLMRLQRHAFSIQFMYRYAAACDTPLPKDAGEGLEESAMDTTHEYVEVPQEEDEWQDASGEDEQYLDACEYRELPSRESSTGRQPAHHGGSASEFALSFESLRRSSNGPSQVLLSPAYADEVIRAAGMAMRSNYGTQNRAVDNLHTGYADTQIVSPNFRGSPCLAQSMGHPMVADNEAEPSRQFASYPSDHGSANAAQRYKGNAEEEKSPSALSIVSFESEALMVSSTPRQHPLAHFLYRNQWAATSDPALSPTESMKSENTNESSASIQTITPMLRRSAPSLSGGPAQYSQMYDNYRAGTLISGARPYNPDLPAFRYADSETDDDSSEESSSSSKNEMGNEVFQTYGFGSDSLRAAPKFPSQTHPDERYIVEDRVRQPKQMPQILDMPIPDWSVINALANQPPREGMESFARSWMQNTPAVMAYQAGTPLSPISEEEEKEPVEENYANCSYCIKYPHKKCPQKRPSTPSRSASTPQMNGHSSASRPSPGRNSFHHSFSRVARLEASPYARTEPIFGSVPATNNRRYNIMGGAMGGTGSRAFSTGISGAPLQRRSTVGSLRRRRGSDGNDSSLRTTFMQGRTPPRLDAHDDDVDAYDEDFFLGDDDANWQIYPDNSSPASAVPLPALGSYQPFSDADRERMANSLQAGMGMLDPDDARRGAFKTDLRPPESAYMPGGPNTPQGTRVASLEGFSGSGRSSDSPRSPIVGESLGDYVVNWNQTAKKKSKDSKLSNPSSDGVDENSPLAKKGKDADKGKGADKPLPASPHPVRTSSLQGNRDKHTKSAETTVTPERTSSLGTCPNEGFMAAEKMSPDKGKSVLARSAAGMELSPEQGTPARGAPYNIFGNAIIQPEMILTPSRCGSSLVRGSTSDNRAPAQCGNSMSPNRVVNLDTNTICKNIADTLSDYSGSYRSLQSPHSMRSNPTPHQLKPKKSIPHSRQGLDAESFTPTEDKTIEEPHKLQLKESFDPAKDKSSDKPKKPKLNKPLPVPRLSPNADDSGTGTPSPSRSPLSFTRIKEKAKTLFMSDKDSKSDKGKKTPDGSANPSSTNDAESAGEGALLPFPERARNGTGSDKSDTPSKPDRFRKTAEGVGGRRKSFGEMIDAD